MAGGLHEASELGVGDRVVVDPQAADDAPVDRALLGVEVRTAHQELPLGDPHHVLGRPLQPRPPHVCSGGAGLGTREGLTGLAHRRHLLVVRPTSIVAPNADRGFMRFG
jgi:hypothetical protein